MRRTATSILRELQVRVARLEKTSGYTSHMRPYTTAEEIDLLGFIERKIKTKTGFSIIDNVDVIRRHVDYDYGDDDQILLEILMSTAQGEEESFHVIIAVDQDGEQNFVYLYPRNTGRKEALKYFVSYYTEG